VAKNSPISPPGVGQPLQNLKNLITGLSVEPVPAGEIYDGPPPVEQMPAGQIYTEPPAMEPMPQPEAQPAPSAPVTNLDLDQGQALAAMLPEAQTGFPELPTAPPGPYDDWSEQYPDLPAVYAPIIALKAREAGVTLEQLVEQGRHWTDVSSEESALPDQMVAQQAKVQEELVTQAVPEPETSEQKQVKADTEPLALELMAQEELDVGNLTPMPATPYDDRTLVQKRLDEGGQVSGMEFRSLQEQGRPKTPEAALELEARERGVDEPARAVEQVEEIIERDDLSYEARANLLQGPTANINRLLPGLEAEYKNLYEVMQNEMIFAKDDVERSEIASRYPGLDKDRPLSIRESAVSELVNREKERITPFLEKLRVSKNPLEQKEYWKNFGLAKPDQIEFNVELTEEGKPQLQLVVKQGIAKQSFAPLIGETDEQQAKRVNEITKIMLNKSFLQFHPEWLVSTTSSIERAKPGATPVFQEAGLDREGLVDSIISNPSQTLASAASLYGYNREEVLARSVQLLPEGQIRALEEVAGFSSTERTLSDVSGVQGGAAPTRLLERAGALADVWSDMTSESFLNSVFDEDSVPRKGIIARLTKAPLLLTEEQAEEAVKLVENTVGVAKRELARDAAAGISGVVKIQFANNEDTIGRTNAAWAPEFLIHDPNGFDNAAILDGFESYRGADGREFIGEGAVDEITREFQFVVDGGASKNFDLIEEQIKSKHFVHELLAGNQFGHHRYMSESVSQHQIGKTALFATPHVQPLEHSMPMLQALYGITNEDLLGPDVDLALSERGPLAPVESFFGRDLQGEAAHELAQKKYKLKQQSLKRQLYKVLRHAYIRSLPANPQHSNIHNYRRVISEQEERDITLPQAIKRWNLSRAKYAAKYKQILMEGFLPTEQKSGFWKDIDVDREDSLRRLTVYYRNSEFVPEDVFMMAHPSTRWISDRKRRRIPLTRDALKYLQPKTDQYKEKQTHVGLVGYNIYETKDQPWDPNGGVVAFNYPISEEKLKAGYKTVGTGVVDYNDAVSFSPHAAHVGKSLADLRNNKPVQGRQNMQGIINGYTRKQHSELFYEDVLKLLENDDTYNLENILFVHLPHSFNQAVHGTYILAKESTLLAGDLVQAGVGGAASLGARLVKAGATESFDDRKFVTSRFQETDTKFTVGPYDDRPYEDLYERTLDENGRFIYTVKTDENGDPLIDPRMAMREVVQPTSLIVALDEVRDQGISNANRKITETVPFVGREMLSYYFNTFTDFDKFKGELASDPLGVGLDVLGFYAVARAAKIPMLSRATKLDVTQLAIKRKQRLGQEITEGEASILEIDSDELYQAVRETYPVEIELSPGVSSRVGAPVPAAAEAPLANPFKNVSAVQEGGYLSSRLVNLGEDAGLQWVPLFRAPGRFVQVLSDLHLDAVAKKMLAGEDIPNSQLTYHPAVVITANTLDSLDSVVPVIGPAFNAIHKSIIKKAAEGTPTGMLASYFLNQSEYMSNPMKVTVQAGNKKVHVLTSDSYIAHVDNMNALSRRLVDPATIAPIEDVLDMPGSSALKAELGQPNIVKMTLKGEDAEVVFDSKYFEDLASDEAFDLALKKVAAGEDISIDDFHFEYTDVDGNNGYFNLEDLGILEKKRGKYVATDSFKAAYAKSSKEARKVLTDLQQEITRQDFRFGDSKVARATSLKTMVKRHGLNRSQKTQFNVLTSDFIDVFDSQRLNLLQSLFVSTMAKFGHVNRLVEGNDGAYMVHFRVADVDINMSDLDVDPKKKPEPGAEPAPEIEPFEGDAAERVIRLQLPNVAFRKKAKKSAPLGEVVEADGQVKVFVDHDAALAVWSKDNAAIRKGSKTHAPIPDADFKSPGEYLDFVVEVYRAQARTRRPAGESAAKYKSRITKEVLDKHRMKRSNLPDAGFVTDRSGKIIRHESVSGNTKAGMRGGQVISLDLVDLGMVQKQGKNYVPSPAMQYIMRQSDAELKVRPGAIRSANGMSAMLTYISRLTDSGVTGLFVVPDGVLVTKAEILSELSPAKVTLSGGIRNKPKLEMSNGVAFKELAETFGLKPMLSVRSKSLLEKMNTLFEEQLTFSNTPDFVDKSMRAKRDKKRPYSVVYYAETNQAVTFADLVEKLKDLTPKKREELNIDIEKLRASGALAEAFDFRDTAIGRIFNNASNDVDSLRKTIALASEQLGQGPNSRVAGKATALNSVAEAATLKRMRSNPNSAVKTALTGLTWEARLAYLEWLKEGTISSYLMDNKHFMNQWEGAGLVNIKNGNPELTPLGVLSTLYTLEYSKHWHQTLFTRAMLTDLPKFGGPGNKFYDYKSLLPEQYAHLSELFTASLSDVQSGLALDLARHINVLGDDSAHGVSNMLTHYSRVYRGTFDKYFHNSNPLEFNPAVATHKAANIGRTYKEVVDAQVNQTLDGQRKVMAVLDPYEASFFSRVEIQQKLHREQQFHNLAREGSLIVGRQRLDGTWAPPKGEESRYIKVDLNHLRTGSKVPKDAVSPLPPSATLNAEARVDAIIKATKPEGISPEVRARWIKESQAIEAAAKRMGLYSDKGPKRDLGYLYGDLIESARQGALFMKRPQAQMMQVEDRVAYKYAIQALAESKHGFWGKLVWNVPEQLIKVLDGATNIADAIRKNPITKQFKIRKLMLSALGPQTRNVQANSMLTALMTPGAFSSKSWWDGFGLYWKSYRNGKRVSGYDQAFLDEITSLELVQSGITADIGYDYTRQNVAIDAWISGLKHEMDDYTASLDKGLSEMDVAGLQGIRASENIALSTRRLQRTGVLDDGDLIKSAEAAVDTDLASKPRAHIARRAVGEYIEPKRKAGGPVSQTRQALMPFPGEGVSPDNWFLMQGKRAFQDTDESFKMGLAYYLYKDKGMRGEVLRAEMFRLWPDYQNITDAEKIFTIKSVFGVYQTKYYRIFTQFMLEHPKRVRAAILMDQYSKASELSDPETMEEWRGLPRFKKAYTSKYGFGFLDESGFSVLSSDRFEMDAWQNPVWELARAAQGYSRLTPEGIPRGAGLQGWFANMLDTMTQVAYGSTQINPVEVGYNFFANDADIGDWEELAAKRNEDPISFWRKLGRAFVGGSGPRTSMVLGSMFGEPSRLGMLKPPESLLNAFLFNLFGVKVLKSDVDEEARVDRALKREATDLMDEYGRGEFMRALQTEKQDTGREAAPGEKQRIDRAAINKRFKDLLSGIYEAETRGILVEGPMLRKAERMFNNLVKDNRVNLPQKYRGTEGFVRLRKAMIKIANDKRKEEIFKKQNPDYK